MTAVVRTVDVGRGRQRSWPAARSSRENNYTRDPEREKERELRSSCNVLARLLKHYI